MWIISLVCNSNWVYFSVESVSRLARLKPQTDVNRFLLQFSRGLPPFQHRHSIIITNSLHELRKHKLPFADLRSFHEAHKKHKISNELQSLICFTVRLSHALREISAHFSFGLPILPLYHISNFINLFFETQNSEKFGEMAPKRGN